MGLDLIRDEMRRQYADALASLDQARAVAKRVADSARSTGRMVLLGMGGSQCMNRIAEPLYRARGIDATALVVSEVLRAPLPPGRRTVLLTSQSGGSGEILRYVERPAGGEERFGMTLDGDSPLGKALPCLVAVGGPEQAFAATRSMTLSLALHGAILRELGVDAAPLVDVLTKPETPKVDAAVEALAGCRAVVYSGRGVLQGAAEAAALGLMELARMPAFAEEGGQFQHGPLEMLGEGIGIVLFRPAGPDAAGAQRLVDVSRAAGCPVVVYDVSGEAPVKDAVTIGLARAEGLAAAAATFPAMQATMIGVATRRVKAVGEPVRSAKVSDGE
ncbi:MAG TPA: SIS domain-containing protein [Dongiaceae bacterium]|nr:SIS domain-containing protein [Dongiaceae bacterium]